jgi:hypothetical protein
MFKDRKAFIGNISNTVYCSTGEYVYLRYPEPLERTKVTQSEKMNIKNYYKTNINVKSLKF